MILSIIIPYYNTKEYTDALLTCLAPQITDEVEVIIIDDGSLEPFKTRYEWCNVIRQKNQGVSTARNAGIDKAKGDYISFIDSDDLVADNFVSKIIEKTMQEPDIIEFSWKSLNNNMWRCNQKLNTDKDRLPNPSVCTRVFKRSVIGDTRFNTHKDSTEDEDFSRKIGYRGNEDSLKIGVITDYMYFYRDDVPMSKTKRYAAGLMMTKRVIYYYDHVTKDMTWLIDEIKKDDEVNEVFLMTVQCDLPQLKRYCQIIPPRHEWGHILKGEKTKLLTLKEPPLRTQVVIYRREIPAVGGIGTFMRHFIDRLSGDYDITILCQSIYCTLYREFSDRVRVITDKVKMPSGRPMMVSGAGSSQKIVCDTLVVPSFLDTLPKTVIPKQVVRMCHACRTDSSWQIPKDYDHLVYVSETAMRSFGVDDGNVIHNMNTAPKDKALIFVSATRFPAPDKGKIADRMRTLAKMLNDKGVSYIWLNFADGKMDDPPANFYNMGPTDRMPEIIKAADYLVQLSDSECWSYSCLEALMSGTPLICTPFPSIYEMGVKDKVNAHIIPFNMSFNVEILKNIPKFNYDYDNETIREEWIKILGDTKPVHDYEPQKNVMTEVLVPYYDLALERDMKAGEQAMMKSDRAKVLTDLKYIKIMGE